MRESTKGYYQQTISAAVATIIGDLDSALDLARLAQRSATSMFHFHRIFRAMTGETALAMSRRLRLERAAHQLANTDKPVAVVAFDAGYDTHEAFTRAFRAAYAHAPSSFRRGRGLRIELFTRSGVHYRPNGCTPFNPTKIRGPIMNVVIVDEPARRVATVAHRGPYNQISTAFERLGAIAGPAGLFGEPGAEMVAIYDDDPEVTAPDELRGDAGIVVPPGRSLPDGLGERLLPAGRYACTTHVGSFELLGDTWAAFLGTWLPSSGHQLAPTAMFEIYRTDMMTTPPPQWRTDLFIPLA